MFIKICIRLLCVILCSFLLAACPKQSPSSFSKRQYSAPRTYTVHGRQYKTMKSSYGYHAKGMASWYGSKFSHQMTSSGERYNMNAFTAAHRTLPLNSYLKVKNIRNGRSVIVRINDRGPFHSNRVVDVSYAAARDLGLFSSGTAMVEIESVSAGERFLQNFKVHSNAQAKSRVQTKPIVYSKRRVKAKPIVHSKRRVKAKPIVHLKRRVKAKPIVHSKRRVKAKPIVHSKRRVKAKPIVHSKRRVKAKPIVHSKRRVKAKPIVHSKRRVKAKPQVHSSVHNNVSIGRIG